MGESAKLLGDAAAYIEEFRAKRRNCGGGREKLENGGVLGVDGEVER